ncbi:MAG: ribulose-phosphate 3-epimerase [Promethearchaeota archaeon]
MMRVAVAIHAVKDFTPDIIAHLRNLDFIHVDVMDGKFVDNINLNLNAFKLLKRRYDIPIVAHLMVINPLKYLSKIADYIELFLFHVEIEQNIDEIINQVKKRNLKVGLVINPPTKIEKIIPYLPKINSILVMSVNPGWSGQKFIPEVVEKINSLVDYKNKFDFEIIVDGGINLNNAKLLINADVLSSSSTILNSTDPNLVIEKLKNIK